MYKLTFNPKIFSRTTRGRRHGRRRGVVLVYVVLCIVVFLASAAIAVDLGFLQLRRAKAQQAADAAALAGAFELANLRTSTADDEALRYASLNGYTNGAQSGQVQVRTYFPIAGAPPNWFRVHVNRPERTIFAGIFGFHTVRVGANGTALFLTLAPMNINGGGTYGKQDGPTTLSLFGPDGYYNNGDCYSVRELVDNSPNPLFTGTGYDFDVFVPTNFTNTDIEIFDPDCYNTNNNANASPGQRVDEWRSPTGGASTNTFYRTTTRYRLYRDNGTPTNPTDDVLVSEASYDGDDSATDMRWNRVFRFNRANFPGQQFRLNVTPTSGSSENGFDLRATQQRNNANDTANFNPNNGTRITATGHLPMNFNRSGNATITLGYVPQEAAGTQLQIRKFDTDVGAQNVTYTCDTLPGFSYTGRLTGNGEFVTDSIPIPANYTGGNWRATYSAGLQDTSVWDMSYTGFGPGRPGGIRLVE